jgi:hypothetical protein
MIMPRRIQLSRSKGYKLDAQSKALNGLPAVNVSRPGRWGNPFVVGETVDIKQAKKWGWWPLKQPDYVAPTPEDAAIRFGAVLFLDEAIHAHVREKLCGRNLACWCSLDHLCHADMLLKLCAEVR